MITKFQNEYDMWTIIRCKKAAGNSNKLLLMKATRYAQNKVCLEYMPGGSRKLEYSISSLSTQQLS